MNYRQRVSSAWSAAATPEDLMRLARDTSPSVRHAVTLNPQTPLLALAGLVNDEDVKVRRAVAQSERVQREWREVLAKDEDVVVRYDIANNPATTAGELLCS